jgi:nicotinic acid mononucleotide adenylyltransferase
MHDPDEAARYALTLRNLRDPERMRQIQATIANLDATAAPQVALIAGGERLANARHIGVLAGSFNPPTLAHLALAASATQTARLDALLWTISQVTVDKEQVTRAPLAERLAVLAALVASRPHDAVAVLNRGLYAAQAEALHATFPTLQRLSFIIGYDKIVQIVDPRYYPNPIAALDELFALAEVWVAPRAGEGEADLTALFAQPENQRWAGRVHFLPLDPQYQTLSSTTLRARIDRQLPIADLTPPEAQALVDAGAYIP